MSTARRTEAKRPADGKPAGKPRDSKPVTAAPPVATAGKAAAPMTSPGAALLNYAAFGSLALGALLIVIGAASWVTHAVPLLLAVVTVGAGITMIPLALATRRRKRAAWAFLTALDGVAAVCLLFGATVLGDKLGVGLAIASLPCLVMVLLTVLLALSAAEIEQ